MEENWIKYQEREAQFSANSHKNWSLDSFHSFRNCNSEFGGVHGAFGLLAAYFAFLLFTSRYWNYLFVSRWIWQTQVEALEERGDYADISGFLRNWPLF